MSEKMVGTCAKCGVERDYLQRDHIVPKYLGGLDELSNIQMLCPNCHADKSRLESSTASKRWPGAVEHRAKLRAEAIGRPLSAEHRAKISAAQRKRWMQWRAQPSRDIK